MSLSLVSSNNREEIKAMQQMYLGHLFTYFQWCWKAKSWSSEGDGGGRQGTQPAEKKNEESDGIWPAGVRSLSSPRSSGRELAEGLQGRESRMARSARLKRENCQAHRQDKHTTKRSAQECRKYETKAMGQKRWQPIKLPHSKAGQDQPSPTHLIFKSFDHKG